MTIAMHDRATTYPLETAIEAFHQHLPITVKLNTGKSIGPGHIVIMYGDVAFRILEEKSNDSHFIRVNDVAAIMK